MICLRKDASKFKGGDRESMFVEEWNRLDLLLGGNCTACSSTSRMHMSYHETAL